MKKIGIASLTLGTLIGAVALFMNPNLVRNVATVIESTQSEAYTVCTQTHSTESSDAFSFTKVKINSDAVDDALYQFKDKRECGTAGCVMYICLSQDGTYTPVPFGYAAETFEVLDTANNDMHDIMLNNDPELTLLWDGNQYGLNAEDVDRNELEFLDQIDF